ncbi:MAG: M16 family metallopeptidase, partial [Candidatus Kapaibacteriota bacterium]
MTKNQIAFLLILIFTTQIGYGKSLQDSLNAAYGASLPSDIRFLRLPNGLRCYLAHNAKPERRAEIRLVINAGSLLEDDDQRGLAHVLEHLAFNGSNRFPKQAIVKYLEERGMDFGAHTNAYTTADETVYKMQIPTDSLSVLATALDIVADWSSSALNLDSAAIEKERSIVIEEWRIGNLGWQGRITHSFLSAFYGDSRYQQRLAIGTKSSLDSFRHEALRRFYRDWYIPKNMALIVVGDIPLDSLECLVRERLSGLPARESRRNIAQERSAMRLLPTSTDSLPIVSVVVDKEMSSIICETHWRSAVQSITTQDHYKQSLLRGLALALVNSRFAELATASAKPPFRNASVTSSEQSRLLGSTSLSLEPSEALFTSYEAALVELRRIKRDGFLPSEIARAKAGFQKSMTMAYNERRNIPSVVRAEALIAHALTGSLVVDPEKQHWRDSSIIAQSSAEDLRQLVNTLFPLGSPQQITFIAVP